MTMKAESLLQQSVEGQAEAGDCQAPGLRGISTGTSSPYLVVFRCFILRWKYRLITWLPCSQVIVQTENLKSVFKTGGATIWNRSCGGPSKKLGIGANIQPLLV